MNTNNANGQGGNGEYITGSNVISSSSPSKSDFSISASTAGGNGGNNRNSTRGGGGAAGAAGSVAIYKIF
jgi:hypothetical protein